MVAAFPAVPPETGRAPPRTLRFRQNAAAVVADKPAQPQLHGQRIDIGAEAGTLHYSADAAAAAELAAAGNHAQNVKQ